MLKKFKNGNIQIKSPYYQPKNSVNYALYTDNIDTFYDNEITQHDLYLNQINGYMYLTDINTQLVYDFDVRYFCQDENYLVQLDDYLRNNSVLTMYSLSKKESESLLQYL
jgi:hypothetical protein